MLSEVENMGSQRSQVSGSVTEEMKVLDAVSMNRPTYRHGVCVPFCPLFQFLGRYLRQDRENLAWFLRGRSIQVVSDFSRKHLAENMVHAM